MNGKVLLVVVRYLMIAVALLHASYSLGARPRLLVTYSLNDVDNKNELECYDGSTLIQSGATFTFRDPDSPEQMRKTFVAERSSYRFTIQSSNESLVSCRVDDSPGSEESDTVMVAAIPQYTAGITAIRQYNYSDTDVVEIECPFPLGRFDSLYEFLWRRVVGEVGAPITNGTRGVYWLAEEYNRTLHVNISAAPDRHFWCVGVVQTCSDTLSCVRRRGGDSPPITIINTIDLATITHPPASVTVNVSETATFDCNATGVGVGNLTIAWDVGGILYYNSETCSDPCDSINSESGDGYVTSTLEITAVSNLSISCVMNQNLNFSSKDPSIEIRVPDTLPPSRTERRTAQLTVTPAVTTATSTQPTTSQGPSLNDPNPSQNLPLDASGIHIVTGVIGSFILIIIFSLAVCIVGIFRYHYKNKESQLGRRLRRTFSRDPHAILERYTQRDPLPRQYDLEIQGTDGKKQPRLYNISQNSGISGVSSYSGMSGVSQNHGPHQMPQFGVPSVHLSLPPHINYNLCTNQTNGTNVAIAPHEQNVASGNESHDERTAGINRNTFGHQLQHVEVQAGRLINQKGSEDDGELSSTDGTSTTYSTVFPCPIVMNVPGTIIETLV